MKLKKFLSLMLALALVLSVISAVWPHTRALDYCEDDHADCTGSDGENETSGQFWQNVTYGPAVYDEDGNILYYEYYTMPYTDPFDYDAYQLTDAQLALPTDELLELVLDSWVVELSFTLVSTPCMESSAYQNARSRFNGLREFEARPDAVEALLAKLAYYVENFEVSEPVDNAWRVLSVLLRQDAYLSRMTPEQQNEVAQTITPCDNGCFFLPEWEISE